MTLQPHIGLFLIKSASKTVIELALELYANHIIKFAKGYLVHQIDALCDTGDEIPHSLYISHAKGYYNIEQVINKLETSKSPVVQKIKHFMFWLHEDDDFIVVEHKDIPAE